MDKLKLVKITVFVLTFLLIFGTLMLLGGIYKKTRKQVPVSTASVSLSQPKGSEIADFKVDNKQIYVLIKKGGLPDRIVVYDRQHKLTTHSISLQ